MALVSLTSTCRLNLCRVRAGTRALHGGSQPEKALFNGGFVLYPEVFNISEQKILLSASLAKLDRTDGKEYRKRRKTYYLSNPLSASPNVQDQFLPDEFYDFQNGHYDGVITGFREMHVTSWSNESPELLILLDRLRLYHPKEPTQVHILHLGSHGHIQPHIDHLSAFGSWIVGVSLGAERIMRLEKSVSDGTPPYDIVLPSGSIYVQKDNVRYNYKHAILERGSLDGRMLQGGQRLSIMVRNRQAIKEL